MIRYVPEFILHQYEQHAFEGDLEGFVFWIGVDGFAPEDRLFGQLSKAGLEELGALMDVAIGQLFAAVGDNGGFICQVERGYCFAVFPAGKPQNVLAAAQRIRAVILANVGSSPLPALAQRFGLRVGHGKLRWRIFPNHLEAEYAFTGEVLEDTKNIPSEGEFLSFSPAALDRLGRHATPHGLNLPLPAAPAIRPGYAVRPETSANFTNKVFHYYDPPLDLRRSVCCWVDLGPSDNGAAQRDLQTLELLAATYGAFIGAVNSRGQSLLALTLFDIPPNQGSKLQRAGKFALEIVKNIPGAKAGIASGILFTGFFGAGSARFYTIMGSAVESASDLVARASSGEVLTDRRLQRQLQGHFQFTPADCPGLHRRGRQARCFRLDALRRVSRAAGADAFVGRAETLKYVGSLIDRHLASGTSAVIMLWGAPGIGKSRLAEEAVAAFEDQACLKLRITCGGEEGKPLGAVGQFVRGALGLAGSEDNGAGASAFRAAWSAFSASNPALRRQESYILALSGQFNDAAPWQTLPPEARPLQFQKAWLDFVAELTSRQPLLIHVDDGQWLDSQSRELFHLLESGGQARIVVLGTTRPLGNEKKIPYALNTFTGYDLKLGPLRGSDVKALCRAHLGLARLPEATFRLISSAAKGNPFHVEQLIAYLSENGLIDSQGRLSAGCCDPDELEISDIILRRVGSLSARVRQCVRNASVLGFRFNIRVLAQMLRGGLGKELRDGAGNRLWKDADDLFYIFSHALIQRSVYDSLLGPELRVLHLAAAKAMEIVYVNQIADHAEEIAHHFRKASEPQKASEYFRIAGNRHWDLMLLPQAEACLASAVETAGEGHGEGSPEQVECQFWLALLYHFLQRFDEAEALYDIVVPAKIRQLGPRSLGLSPYLNNLGRYYKDRGRYAEAEKLLRRSLRMEQKLSPESSNVADRINNIGHLYSLREKYPEAATQFRAALDVMDRNYEPNHWFTAVCASNLAGALLSLDRMDEAEPLILRSIDISRQAWGEEHVRTANHFFRLALLRRKQQRLPEAASLLRRVLAIHERAFGSGHPHTQKVVHALREIQE